MTIGIPTTYVDPGAYVQQIPTPNGINTVSQGFAPCLIATGDRNATISNESVVKGIISNEALTLSGSSPYTATLVNRSNKSGSSTTVFQTLSGIKNAVPSQYVTFNPAFVLGTVTTAVSLSSNLSFSLIADNIQPITIILQYAASPTAPTAIGRDLYTQATFSGTGGNAATMTQIAAAINAALTSTAGAALGFGSNYSSFASTSGGALLLTSPVTNSALSDVEVFSGYSLDGVATIFGSAVAGNRKAQSVITLATSAYNSSATYTINYASIDSTQDPLSTTSNIQSLVSIGSSSGASNFSQGTDYQLTGQNVDWSIATAATVTGVAGPTFNISTNTNIVLGFDGLSSSYNAQTVPTDILITLNGLSNPPLGYANPVTASAATAAEIANNINAVVCAALGPVYDGVATVTTVGGVNAIKLTSPTKGLAGSLVYVKAAPTISATNTIFGAPTVRSILGTGKTPSAGSFYYVTYKYTRPTAQYNVPYQCFSVQQALAQVGLPSVSVANYNPMAIAVNLAFTNGAPYVYVVQINDTTVGNPTRQQILDALNGARTVSGTTDMIVVGEPGTRIETQSDMISTLQTRNSLIENQPCRGWFGMASNTPIGSPNTAASFVYESTQLLQVPPTDPARGRMFLVVPPQQSGCSYTVTFNDGTSARLQLDSTYLAVCWASQKCALLPADTLTGLNIAGINVDDITTPWTPGQRRTLAGAGCFVTTFQGGKLICKDALSTEGGGSNQVSYRVDSTSFQKDIVTEAVISAINTNIVGIVPFDLATFLLDIKLVIQGAITNAISAGAIGPYRDQNGNIRSINLATDIVVQQNVNDATAYSFNYFYFLRYPALRIYGTYTVDASALSAGINSIT